MSSHQMIIIQEYSCNFLYLGGYTFKIPIKNIQNMPEICHVFHDPVESISQKKEKTTKLYG